MSLFAFCRSTCRRIHAACLFFTFFALAATAYPQADLPLAQADVGRTQPAAGKAAATDKAPADKAAADGAAANKAAETVTITSVAVFPQSQAAQSQNASSQDFVLEITGTGFAGIDMSSVHIAVLPSTGVTPNPTLALARSADNSKILAQFIAPTDFVLEEIVLSAGSALLPFNAGTPACDFKSKVTLTPQMSPKTRFGISTVKEYPTTSTQFSCPSLMNVQWRSLSRWGQ